MQRINRIDTIRIRLLVGPQDVASSKMHMQWHDKYAEIKFTT